MLALMVQPDAAWAADRKTWALCTNSDADKAITACTKIAEDRRETLGDRSAAYINRGFSHAAKNDNDRAIADYSEAILLMPNDAKAYLYRGNRHAAKGDHTTAISDFTRAIALNPSDAEAYYNRGVSYGNIGNNDLAISDCSKSINRDPIFASAYYNRGNRYAAKGEHDLAITDFSVAIKVNPGDAKAYFNRGLRYEAKGEQDRAIADFTKAIEFNPRLGVAYYSRGLLYLAKGDRDRAIADQARASVLPIDEKDDFSRRKAIEARNQFAKLMAQPVTGATQFSKLSTPAPAPQVRMALLIANSAYTAIDPLKNPKNDIEAVAEALTAAGFEVLVRHDLGREALFSELRKFEQSILQKRPDWALVYFSGHGAETHEGTFWLPTDIIVPKEGEAVSDVTILEDAVKVQNALRRMQAAKLRLVVHDACRDNPVLSRFYRLLNEKKGTSDSVHRATGLGWGSDAILYATAARTFAQDGKPGDLSPFAQAFVEAMSVEGLEMAEFYRRVQASVAKTTSAFLKQPQVPDAHGFPLNGSHYFRPAKPN